MVAVEKTAQQDIVWNSDDHSLALLYHTESVSWHAVHDKFVPKALSADPQFTMC